MVVGVASVAGAKTAEMFFLDRRTIAEPGEISGPFTIELLDRMRSKTEVNSRNYLALVHYTAKQSRIGDDLDPRATNITSAKFQIKIL